MNILVDEIPFQPMGIAEYFNWLMHQYNEAVFNDPRLHSVVLSLGGRLTLSVHTS